MPLNLIVWSLTCKNPRGWLVENRVNCSQGQTVKVNLRWCPRHWSSVGLVLGQRLWRRPNTEPTLGHRDAACTGRSRRWRKKKQRGRPGSHFSHRLTRYVNSNPSRSNCRRPRHCPAAGLALPGSACRTSRPVGPGTRRHAAPPDNHAPDEMRRWR